jgi:hypothetical protein
MRFALLSPAIVCAFAAGLATFSCGGDDNHSNFSGDDASTDASIDASLDGSADAAPDVPTVHDDFPMPVFDNGAPMNSPGLFGTDGGGAMGGPCLFEPEMGSLFPNNWLRPRFRFNTAHNENLFEIKLAIPNEVHPLVIYTTQSGYKLDKAAWAAITNVAQGSTIHVTIRSAVLANGALTAGPFLGTEGDIEIAPVSASGSIVYWTTSGGTVLKGFKIGDETVQPVITPSQSSTACVACHTSTPDGVYVGLTASGNINDGSGPGYISIRSIAAMASDAGIASEPPFLSPSAKTLLARQDQHAPSFSISHWRTGDHTMLSMLPVAGKTEIVWTDLEATSTAQGTGWGVIARMGDANAASAGVFSRDGSKIVYSSTSSAGAGVITSDGALYTVPYANRAGGAATPLMGANDAAYHHFYPTFAADDRLIAFNRVAAGQSSYNDPTAEVFVVPSAGGTATRLAANDPPACLGKPSPGITNSWPKWSPEVKGSPTSLYYFLVFSSTRNAATMGPQLYVAPIVVTNGVVKSYAALYLWNQPEMEHNHTPAWDVFQLPPPR